MPAELSGDLTFTQCGGSLALPSTREGVNRIYHPEAKVSPVATSMRSGLPHFRVMKRSLFTARKTAFETTVQECPRISHYKGFSAAQGEWRYIVNGKASFPVPFHHAKLSDVCIRFTGCNQQPSTPLCYVDDSQIIISLSDQSIHKHLYL